MEGPLERLKVVAEEFSATVSVANGVGTAGVTITRPSGASHTFDLTLTAAGNSVSVRETLGGFLPACCPDRHINTDSSFCLGWGDDDPQVVADVEAARRWWRAVHLFLSRQLNVQKRRVFPGSEHGRAHGAAARSQALAEEAAEQLGTSFVDQVRAGRMVVRKDPKVGKHRIDLWLDDEQLARVSLRSKEITDSSVSCPCGTARPLVECGNHAKVLLTFMINQHKSRQQDQRFIDEMASAGQKCCDTLKECGLRNALRKPRHPTTSGKSNARQSKFWRPAAKSKRPR